MSVYSLTKTLTDGRVVTHHTAFRFYYDQQTQELSVEVWSYGSLKDAVAGCNEVEKTPVVLATGPFDPTVSGRVLSILSGMNGWAGLTEVPL